LAKEEEQKNCCFRGPLLSCFYLARQLGKFLITRTKSALTSLYCTEGRILISTDTLLNSVPPLFTERLNIPWPHSVCCIKAQPVCKGFFRLGLAWLLPIHVKQLKIDRMAMHAWKHEASVHEFITF